MAGLSVEFDEYFTRANVELRHTGERVGYYLTRGGANTQDNRYVLPFHGRSRSGDDGLRDGSLEAFKDYLGAFLLDSQFDYPGFQPYYRVDIPGEPRRFVVMFEQTL